MFNFLVKFTTCLFFLYTVIRTTSNRHADTRSIRATGRRSQPPHFVTDIEIESVHQRQLPKTEKSEKNKQSRNHKKKDDKDSDVVFHPSTTPEQGKEFRPKLKIEYLSTMFPSKESPSIPTVPMTTNPTNPPTARSAQVTFSSFNSNGDSKDYDEDTDDDDAFTSGNDENKTDNVDDEDSIDVTYYGWWWNN